MRAMVVGLAMGVALAAAGCGPQSPSGQKPDASSARQIAANRAALDPCAQALKGACADTRIAAAGAEVKAALTEAAGKLSPEGLALLAQGERGWIEAQRLQCRISDGPLNAEQAACLRAVLASRARQAGEMSARKGPFTFQTVEVNRADLVDAARAAGVRYVLHSIQFPRIDGAGPAAQKFNEAARRAPRFTIADKTEETTTYRIGYAGEDLISVRYDQHDLTVGAARPNVSMSALNFNMRTGAALGADEVFKAGASWREALAARAARDLTRQMREQDELARVLAPSDVKDSATDANLWFITDQALVVLFPAGSLAPASLEAFEVTIPWADLKSMLNPKGPGPIKSA